MNWSWNSTTLISKYPPPLLSLFLEQELCFVVADYFSRAVVGHYPTINEFLFHTVSIKRCNSHSDQTLCSKSQVFLWLFACVVRQYHVILYRWSKSKGFSYSVPICNNECPWYYGGKRLGCVWSVTPVYLAVLASIDWSVKNRRRVTASGRR